MKTFRTLLTLTTFLSASALASPTDFQDCAARGNTCTFVLLNAQTQALAVVNPERAKTRMTPFSTFKVPNSVVMFQTGVVKNLTDTFEVDLTRIPKQDWWFERWTSAPMTFRDAFQNSALPLYQQFSQDVGAKRMQQLVDVLEYGNRDTTGGIDQFWLNSSLKISAIEQVFFLQKLFDREFAVATDSIDKLEQIMWVKDEGDHQLYAKTGGGRTGEKMHMGWYVGMVKNGEDRYYFALNISGKPFRSTMGARKPLVMQELQKRGIWPQP